MNASRGVVSAIAVAGTTVAVFLAAGLATGGTRQPATGHQMAMAGNMGMMGNMEMTKDELSKECQAMLSKRKDMMRETKAMDAKLDEMMKAMNRASGSKKVEAMASVLNELVAQRHSMQGMMMTMEPEMMGHMMAHMSGMEMGMGESASMCPMMEGMASKEGGHSEHH